MKEHLNILVLSSRGHRRHINALKERRNGQMRPGQRVRLKGRDEEFIVLRIDHRRHLADLLRQGEISRVENGIPLALLRAPGDPDDVDRLRIPA